MAFYKKEDDLEILEQIKPIIKVRSTYGYKRVTAILNQMRAPLCLPKLNRKRIYRVMKMNGLILPKTGISQRIHRPTGKVMTLFSNTRWASDCFEIKCFNGEKVYASFIIDCCDREIISFIAKETPILSEDIQLLMMESVEKRFSSTRAPREIEFLSDRGAIYRAYNVQEFGRKLGLKSCFTAAYSPESNGMSESLVHTLKRDYVYVSDCESAEKVLEMFSNWIFDYNNEAPHSALKMMSPVDFKKSRTQIGEGHWEVPVALIANKQIILKRENERVLLN